MKKKFTILLAFMLAMAFQATAQQIGDEIFVLDLTIDGQTTTYKEEACGFSAPDDWGGPLTGDVCLPIVWGYGATDSLGCDSLLSDYTGKMVMLRRGVCEFGAKALNAQKSGAAAVAIANSYAATAGDACNQPGMGGGAVGAQVTTTMPVMFCRNLVDVIDAALKAGKQPVVCFRRLSLYNPSAEYAHATPLSQVDTVELITMSCVNRTGIAQDFTAKVEITDPAGTVTVLESTQFIDVAADSIFYFDSYVPTPLVGTYNLVYTADKATNVGDTLYRSFIVTQHTFATDNFILAGGAANNASFVTGGQKYSAAALYKTGDTPLTVKLASFGINNAAAVASATDPSANLLNLIVYDADPDNNGTNDVVTTAAANHTAFDALPFVAFGEFQFDATTPVDAIQNVELSPIDGEKVVLQPNHFYYLRLLYDGTIANSGIQLSLTCSRDANYDVLFTGASAITPITLDNFYSGGWGGATVVARMHDEAYVAPVSVKPVVLGKTQYSLTPNPAVDFTEVNLQLEKVNKSVIVSLIDFNGAIVSSKVVKNFKNGQIKLDTRSLPSGYYAVSIRTSEEGSAMSNLMICH